MSSRRCCAKDCFNSQTATKGISYFGFPKSEYYAIEWAIAAGREDLTSKSLPLLTKYFLCSEHFTDDCFLDPPDNTKLKKTKNPVSAPIPTIFRNNIGKFLPKSLRPVDSDPTINEQVLSIKPLHGEETTTVLVIPETLAQLAQEETREEAISIEQTQSLIEETHEFIYDTDYLTELETASDNELCRLCANSFNDEELIYIFDNNIIAQTIETLLPGEVKEDDDLSHMICSICLDKASECFNVIREFRGAQVLQKKLKLNDAGALSND